MPLLGPALSDAANLADLLAGPVAVRPDEPALITEDRTWTTKELRRDVCNLAAQLMAKGLQSGDRVASLMPNCGELLIHYLACLQAGLVVVPLNYRYTTTEIDYALAVSEAAMLLVHAERVHDIEASAVAGKLTSRMISFGGPLGEATRLEALIERPRPSANSAKPNLTDPALVFFTSGSTGKPKGVTHSLSSFGCNVASWAQSMALSARDVVLPGASIAHVGALCTSLAAFSAGSSVVLACTSDADEILSLLRKHRPSILHTLPSPLMTLARHQSARRGDFASVRMCISGSDKFPTSLREEFAERTGLLVKETYGLTEAANCLSNLSGETARAGSLGSVSPGYAASVRDDHGQEVSPEVDGNLWLKGAPVMVGYWNDQDATHAAMVDGWFDTGDVMRVDGDGHFWFRGRKKQIIVHDGSNISPQEVEEAIMAHPAVDLVGVVGVSDDERGENVWAYVTFKDTFDPPSGQEIMQFAVGRVGYKAPERIVILREMPMNATGKVDRMVLRRRAAAEASETPGSH